MMQWIGAGDGINLNYRFSQPGRTERNRQDHLFAEGVFPFANVTTTDPFTGKVDSRYANCAASNTCPLAAEIYSANEYWVKAGSLLHTDPTGTVDPDSPYARDYFISSHQHGVGNGASKGNCQQLQNPLDSQPIQRALFIALDEWSTKGIQPPPSRVPRFSDGTLVPPLPQAGMGFPNISGVTYTGLKTTRYLFNYGPGYYDGGPAGGVASINPPMITPPYEDNSLNGSIYPSFIPKTDSDGNDIAGVRLPDVTVPLATYTGWALRSGVWANDGCESSGQYIPFAKTQADRTASGDPRPATLDPGALPVVRRIHERGEASDRQPGQGPPDAVRGRRRPAGASARSRAGRRGAAAPRQPAAAEHRAPVPRQDEVNAKRSISRAMKPTVAAARRWDFAPRGQARELCPLHQGAFSAALSPTDGLTVIFAPTSFSRR